MTTARVTTFSVVVLMFKFTFTVSTQPTLLP